MSRLYLISAAVLLTACADSPLAPSRAAIDTPVPQNSGVDDVFQRYVAMGTSLSMGVASDGVFMGTQVNSWPAQLARQGGGEISQPYILSPGCRSPIAAPLGAGVRLSGEPVLADPATLSCAPLLHGVPFLAQNVAINGARVADALLTTPENSLDPGNRNVYARVLLPGQTQVSEMAAQNPALVSVEFGANEVLSVQSGVALVGGPPLPLLDPQTFAAQYRQLLDRVTAAGAKYVVLVGLPTDPLSIPAFRAGGEIAANAAVLLAAFNVAVQADCSTTNTHNQIFVTVKLATTIQAGLAARAANQPPVPFTCAGAGPTTPDFVLTLPEQQIVTGVVAQMNAAIQSEAQARGYAYFNLDALYAAPGVRAPLNAVALFTTAAPFGPFMSLDGVHPNAAGQALIAQAAARALNQRYNLGIPVL